MKFQHIIFLGFLFLGVLNAVLLVTNASALAVIILNMFCTGFLMIIVSDWIDFQKEMFEEYGELIE